MRIRNLVLAALVALPLAACGAVGEQPAASVRGTDIDAASIRDEIHSIQSDDTYRTALEQAYGASTAGAGKGTLDQAFVTQVLSLRIYYALLEDRLQAEGQPVGSQDLAKAKSAIERQFDGLGDRGRQVLAGLPTWYRDMLIRQQALVAVAGEVQAEQQPTARGYYDAHKDDFVVACVSHILVGLDGRTDAQAKAKAEDLKAQLDGGADFGRLARANSDDASNAAKSGDLGCGPRGQFVQEFDDATFDAVVGKPTGPVKTSFGYHLILVRSRAPKPFAEATAEVEQALAKATDDGLNTFLAKVTCDPHADVHVSSRYGRWDRSPCAQKGYARVTPPERPTTTTAQG